MTRPLIKQLNNIPFLLLDSHQFTGEVGGDEEEAQRLGIRAVPSFVSNGRILATGVQTPDRLRELLTKGPGLGVF